MVQNKFNLLGLECTKLTPTVAEWSAKWGEESVRREATLNVWYRSTAPEIRDLFLHGQDEVKDDKGNVVQAAVKGVDDISGIARKTKVVKLKSKNEDGSDKTSEVWDPEDSESKYFNRVCAELVAGGKFPDVAAAKASFQAHFQACADLVEFDASKAEPKEKKAKALSQVFLTAAKSAIDKGNGQKLAKLLSKSIGTAVGAMVDGKFVVTVEQLAQAMKTDDENLRAKRQQELNALVNG